jgi:hypothetical protein
VAADLCDQPRSTTCPPSSPCHTPRHAHCPSGHVAPTSLQAHSPSPRQPPGGVDPPQAGGARPSATLTQQQNRRRGPPPRHGRSWFAQAATPLIPTPNINRQLSVAANRPARRGGLHARGPPQSHKAGPHLARPDPPPSPNVCCRFSVTLCSAAAAAGRPLLAHSDWAQLASLPALFCQRPVRPPPRLLLPRRPACRKLQPHQCSKRAGRLVPHRSPAPHTTPGVLTALRRLARRESACRPRSIYYTTVKPRALCARSPRPSPRPTPSLAPLASPLFSWPERSANKPLLRAVKAMMRCSCNRPPRRAAMF